jgi:superfamily II DNA helicase RecQ
MRRACRPQARAFPGTPVVALTATATDAVKVDVIKLLCMARGCSHFQARRKPGRRARIATAERAWSDCSAYGRVCSC